MALALIVVAILLGVIGITGNYAAAGQLFNQTFFGSNGQSGFVTWFASLFGIAVVFRLLGLPAAGNAFIGLIILVYMLTHTGILSAIQSAVTSGVSAAGSAAASASPSSSGSGAASAATGALSQVGL